MKRDIVVIIPARGGSKGIPKKNIYPLGGRPLLTYTIEAVMDSGVTNNIFVSTDSREIAKVAGKSGVCVINRPEELAGDKASTESAVIHALMTINNEKQYMPEFVLTLPPTSPLRKPATIKQFVDYFLSVSDSYDAMLSLTESRQDYWIRDANSNFRRLFPSAPRRRQEREPIYIENSSIYITKTQALLRTNSILGEKCTGYLIDDIEAVDINSLLDLQWAEFILKNILE